MRQRPWLLAWLVPLGALVYLAIAFGGTMGHSGARLAGSNSVVLQKPILQIPGGSLLCQATVAPKDAASVQLFVVPAGPQGPPLDLTITDGAGRTISTGHMAGGWSGGVIKVPLARIRSSAADGKLCIRNRGRDALALGGVSSQFLKALIDGKPQDAAITMLFFRDGSETWTSLLPTIGHRVGVLKGSVSGAWVFWLALVLVALAGVLSMAVMLRSSEA
jgi:hypothetical protein